MPDLVIRSGSDHIEPAGGILRQTVSNQIEHSGSPDFVLLSPVYGFRCRAVSISAAVLDFHEYIRAPVLCYQVDLTGAATEILLQP